MNMHAQCILPAELIFQILYHSDPRDIVRWKTVSKWFRTIASDDVLWRAWYRNAPFPNPPGPSPSESTESIQRTLVKSAQLAQSWTTRPMRDLSSTKVHLRGEPSNTLHKLICGRWLMACESKRRFVLHDVNAGAGTHEPQVLWEEREPVVLSWIMCWKTSVEGQCVMYVLYELPVGSGRRKLLEFRLNDQSGELYDSIAMDVPGSWYMHNVELHIGKSPFLLILNNHKRVVFDMRTRVFYQLPEFRPVLLERLKIMHPSLGVDESDVRYWMAFTDTHLVSFCRPYTHVRSLLGFELHMTVVQVFALPPDGPSVKNENPVLRITHEGVQYVEIINPEVLKVSVDPATGDTVMTLLDYTTTRPWDTQVSHVYLVIPEPSPVEVLEVGVGVRGIPFPKDGELKRHCVSRFQYVDISDDGCVRGFYRAIPRVKPGQRKHRENDHIMKFAIDTTQYPWVVTCGKLSPAEWSHIEDSWVNQLITFDGKRGKLCFADPKHYKDIVVVDIE